MLELEMRAEDVALIRFGPDPVWETVASLGVLAHPHKHPSHRALAGLVREPRWDHELLLGLMAAEEWYPTLLAPVPHRAAIDPAHALGAVAGTDTDVAAADLDRLRQSQPEHPRWRRTTPARLVEETAVALVGYWTHVLAPMWQRVRDITDADIAYRSRALAADGLGATLGGLHERMTYGDGRIRLRMPGEDRSQQVNGTGVRLVPSVFRWPCLVAEIDSAPPVISYAARGSGRLWESAAPYDAPGLDPVLGRSRVAILSQLSAPNTTTRLARLLRLSNGTVNEHLTALQRAGLLTSSRRGREVLYERTDLGHALMQQWR